jgi:hypothetical protein
MAGQIRNKVGYGLSEALPVIAPAPIVAKRAPNTSDKAPIGQEWVNTVTNQLYFLTSIANNLANWILVEIGGGAGVFANLTVNPGPTALSTVGNGAVTIGNATNTGAITLVSGLGNLAINGAGNAISIGNDAAANLVIIGSTTAGALTTIFGGNGTGVGSAAILLQTAAAGDIQIGATTQTGAIYLGTSTAAAGSTVNIANGVNTGTQVVNIANGNSGATSTVNILSGVATAGTQTLNMGNGDSVKAINIGNGVSGNTILIGNGINTGAQIVSISSGAAAADSTVNILAGNGTAGTQTGNFVSSSRACVVNVGTGVGAHNINLGGTGNNIIALGNLQLGGSISIGTAMTTGTIAIGSVLSGLVSMPGPSVSAAGTTVVNNVRVGQAIYTGNVTGNGVALVLTLTNSFITTTCKMLLTASNNGANDAQMTIYRIKKLAGSATITLFNNGAAALNGDVHLDFFIFN